MRAVLGCSLHTGWAETVAVGGSPADPEVLRRYRITLVDEALPRQVFHAAAGLPAAPADALVRQVERSAREAAERELVAARDALLSEGHQLAGVALCAEPRDVPTDTQRIVANHTLIHSAEGELYREALEAAAEWLALPVLQVGPKRVAGEVTQRLGLSTSRQGLLVADLRRRVGPPWRADHKQATLLALVALAEASVAS